MGARVGPILSTSNMTLPTLSINGTAKSELFENAAEAKLKLEIALDAFRKTYPHARDHQYAEPGVYETVTGEYWARLQSIKKVIADLETLMEHTD